jgi:hypothetical protein
VNERECIFFTQFDIFPGQMSYVNHRGPYVAPLGYIGYYIAGVGEKGKQSRYLEMKT